MYTPNSNAAAELLITAYRFSHEARLGRIDIAHAVEDGDVSKDELHTLNLYFEDLELKSKRLVNQYIEWRATASDAEKQEVGRYISRKNGTSIVSMGVMELYLEVI